MTYRYPHGNEQAREGCDRCTCGCKYWEADRCVDCGNSIHDLLCDMGWVAENRPERRNHAATCCNCGTAITYVSSPTRGLWLHDDTRRWQCAVRDPEGRVQDATPPADYYKRNPS